MKTLHYRNSFVLLLLSVMSLFFLAFVSFANPHGVSSHTQVEDNLKKKALSPDVYQVDIIVLNISDINLNAGTYKVDMFISFICKDSPCKNEPSWDVMNATEDIAPVDQGTSIPLKSYARLYPFGY